MTAERGAADRMLDFAMFVPIGTALFVRDASKLAFRAAGDAIGYTVSYVAANALDSISIEGNVEQPAEPAPTTVRRERDESHSEPPASVAAVASNDVDDESLPIDGYDHLAARQVIGRLADLTAEELELVAGYEAAHRNRQTVLRKIEQIVAG